MGLAAGTYVASLKKKIHICSAASGQKVQSIWSPKEFSDKRKRRLFCHIILCHKEKTKVFLSKQGNCYQSYSASDLTLVS